jgi:anti-sigma-K factor RskA
MIDEVTEERASLYVLGILEEEEAAIFTNELRGNLELAELVADLQRVTALLAADVPRHSPPPEMKQRILDRIRGEQPAPVARSGAFGWLGWAAAAALLCASVTLFLERDRLKADVAALRHRDVLAGVEIVRLRSQLAQTPAAGAVAIWDSERQRGVLDLAQLPPPRADQDYQLWLIDPAYADPVNGGIIRVNNRAPSRMAFAPSKPVHELAKLAVSLERRGGVEKAQGPIVLLSE